MNNKVLLSNEANEIINFLTLNLQKSLNDCEKIHDIDEKETIEKILNKFKKETAYYINRYKQKELRKLNNNPKDVSDYFVKFHTGGLQ